MDLYEYQGRELFARHGLPVLSGGVAQTPDEATAIAQQVGRQVVVKAQVKVGGRGKAGGVKLADTGASFPVNQAVLLAGLMITGGVLLLAGPKLSEARRRRH